MAPLARALLALFPLGAAAAAGCEGGGCPAEEREEATLLALKRETGRQQGPGAPYPSVYQGYDFSPYASPQEVAPEGSTCSALGILMMDGYVWPTQPGDISDLRTWCRVANDKIDDPHYKCEEPLGPDEFGMVFARIDGLVFGGGPQGVESFGNADNFKDQFKTAVSLLLADPRVCAITGNVGFFSQYQVYIEGLITELEEESGVPIYRKPMILGPPVMTAAFAPKAFGEKVLPVKWPTLQSDELVLILTSNYGAFNPADGRSVCKLLREFQIKCPKEIEGLRSRQKLEAYLRDELKGKLGMDVPEGEERSTLRTLLEMFGSSRSADEFAHSFIAAGFNGVPGYTAVDSTGGFHNTWLAMQSYQGLLNKTFNYADRKGKKIVGIIAESTEMPAHSNGIRMDYHLPVWDSSTIGICLVRAGKSGNYERFRKDIAISTLGNSEFFECMMEWFQGIGSKGRGGKWVPGKLEPKFGHRPDGILRWFEDTTPPLSRDALMALECAGGRSNPVVGVPAFSPPIGRLMSSFDWGQPRFFGVNPVCYTTPECKCPYTKNGNLTGYPGCSTECPGVGTICGYPSRDTDNCNTDGKVCSVCGIRGEKCSTGQVKRPKGISTFQCQIDVEPGPGPR